MTGFKNVIEGIGHFIEKLFKSKEIQDALDPVAQEVTKKVVEALKDVAEKTDTKIDDLLVAVVKNGLEIKPVDPKKLND